MSSKYKRKPKRTHKQKLFLMHGCSKNKSCKHTTGGSGCGPGGCPISPYSWKQMNARGGKNVIKGGSHFYKSPPPIPGPFIGKSWGTSLNNWPGVDGISSNHNWLAYNKYMPDITRQIKLGGSRKRHNKSYKKGGGFSLLPQDLVNLGRDFNFNFKSAYNSLNGYKAPIDPLPYKDQLTRFNTNKIIV